MKYARCRSCYYKHCRAKITKNKQAGTTAYPDLVLDLYFIAALKIYGRRAFAVAGPTTWNSLSVELRDPDLGDAAFGRSLKTFLFRRYSVH